MRKYEIHGVKKCQELIDWMQRHEYSVFQHQYFAYSPEGFYATFTSHGLEDIQIHTFKRDIEEMIVKYKKPGR